jgi:hypothetical protein
VPPVELKEQLHHIPVGWTKHPLLDDRKRATALANGWHVGVARFLIWIILTQFSAGSTITTFTPQLNVPPHPHVRPLQKAAQAFLASRTPLGPLPQTTPEDQLHHTTTFHEHFTVLLNTADWSDDAFHTDPSSHYTMQQQILWGHDLTAWREAVLQDLTTLIEEMSDETLRWVQELPTHIQAVYRQDWAPHGIVQIPVLCHLLSLIEWPGMDKIRSELNSGFPMLGQLTPGTGWPVRTDSNYQQPWTIQQLQDHNIQYSRECATRKPSKHWQLLLQEILAERALHRTEGPFSAPEWMQSSI